MADPRPSDEIKPCEFCGMHDGESYCKDEVDALVTRLRQDLAVVTEQRHALEDRLSEFTSADSSKFFEKFDAELASINREALEIQLYEVTRELKEARAGRQEAERAEVLGHDRVRELEAAARPILEAVDGDHCDDDECEWCAQLIALRALLEPPAPDAPEGDDG